MKTTRRSFLAALLGIPAAASALKPDPPQFVMGTAEFTPHASARPPEVIINHDVIDREAVKQIERMVDDYRLVRFESRGRFHSIRRAVQHDEP